MSRSGGQSVLLADEAFRHGFGLARLSRPCSTYSQRSKGEVIRRTNPFDLGDVFDEISSCKSLKGCSRRAAWTGWPSSRLEINASAIPDIVKGTEDSPASTTSRCFSVWSRQGKLVRGPRRRTFPSFRGPPACVSGLTSIARPFQEKERKEGRKHASRSGPRTANRAGAAESPLRLASAADALALAKAMGCLSWHTGWPGTETEAIDAARKLGYPIVLKQAEPPVLDKTEGCAVRLSIRNDAELDGAIDAMPADLYLLQRMAPTG